MKKSKNLLSKSTTVYKPYATYQREGWIWHILKTYQLPKNEYTNKYARWYTAVKSPFTYGSYEYGDTYVMDIIRFSKLTYASKDFKNQYTTKKESEE